MADTSVLRPQGNREARHGRPWIGVWFCIALAVGTAGASVPTSNELGVRFKVLKTGVTATIEIRITPRREFDSVAVEAASGVASLSPPCAFSDVTAVPGGSYVCTVDVTGDPSAAAMTINVVARRAIAGYSVPETEVHHLSVKNPAFSSIKKIKAASHHDVADPAATHK